MLIKDLELLNNIEELFIRDNVLYGAGTYGAEIADLFEEADIDICYFCDKNRKEFRDYKIITLDELRQINEKREINIIVTSMKYAEQICEDILYNGICNSHVYSYAGVWQCFGLNIESPRLSHRFRRNFCSHREQFLLDLSLKETTRLLFQINMNIGVYQNCGILIFQPGKVGSDTVKKSLEAVNVPCVHLHSFSQNVYWKNQMQMFEHYVRKVCDRVKIVTLVREPIARDISMYMHQLSYKYFADNILQKDIIKGITEYLDNSAKSVWGAEFSWFDNLTKLTGINIFDYPFNKEKGYEIIREGKWEILILKMEMLDRNTSTIAEFIENKDFRLLNSNIGDEKLYKFLYAQVKRNLIVSDLVLDRYYLNNARMNHFYTSCEREAFMKRYKEKKDNIGNRKSDEFGMENNDD